MAETLEENVKRIFKIFRGHHFDKKFPQLAQIEFEKRGLEISTQEIEEAMRWMLKNGYIGLHVGHEGLSAITFHFVSRKPQSKKKPSGDAV